MSTVSTEAVEVSLTGFSLGAVNVQNFAWKMNLPGKKYSRYWLDNKINVKRLVEIDPVLLPFRGRHGPVTPNVEAAASFWEDHRHTSVVQVGVKQNGVFVAQGTSVWGNIANALHGTPTTGSTDVRVDIDLKNVEVIRHYVLPTSPAWGRLTGGEVNHANLIWYVFDMAADKFL